MGVGKESDLFEAGFNSAISAGGVSKRSKGGLERCQVSYARHPRGPVAHQRRLVRPPHFFVITRGPGDTVVLRSSRTGDKGQVPVTQFAAKQQHTLKIDTERPTFTWNGKDRRPTVAVAQLSELDKRSHTTSLTPNIVHSLDAAHLMLTVFLLPTYPDQEEANIGTVHDSFAVSAVQAPMLARAFKSAFAWLYTGGAPSSDSLLLPLPEGAVMPVQPLDVLAQQFAAQCEQLPPPPAQGTLRLDLFEPGFTEQLLDAEPLK